MFAATAAIALPLFSFKSHARQNAPGHSAHALGPVLRSRAYPARGALFPGPYSHLGPGPEGSHGLRPVSASPGRPRPFSRHGIPAVHGVDAGSCLRFAAHPRHAPQNGRSGRFPPSSGQLYPGAGAVGPFLQCHPMPALRRKRGHARHPLAPNAPRPASFRTSFRS